MAVQSTYYFQFCIYITLFHTLQLTNLSIFIQVSIFININFFHCQFFLLTSLLHNFLCMFVYFNCTAFHFYNDYCKEIFNTQFYSPVHVELCRILVQIVTNSSLIIQMLSKFCRIAFQLSNHFQIVDSFSICCRIFPGDIELLSTFSQFFSNCCPILNFMSNFVEICQFFSRIVQLL